LGRDPDIAAAPTLRLLGTHRACMKLLILDPPGMSLNDAKGPGCVRRIRMQGPRAMPWPSMKAMAPVTSKLLIEAPAKTVYDFLSQLPNHQRMGGHRFRLDTVTPDRLGATIVICGPLGIHRTVQTTITYLHPARGVGGTATVGRRTIAHVHWTINPAGEQSHVALTATMVRTGVLDRLLLAAGGRKWLARNFHQVLTLLSTTIRPAAPEATAPVSAPNPDQKH
jgi:hypothetical protein